jgi:hypothetical protein
MDLDGRILYQVAFKGVIDLVAAGEVEFETSDIVLETIELTDAFYEALATKTGGGSEGKSSSRRSSSSKKSASTRGGNTSRKSTGPKDPDADATPAQIKFLKKLLDDNNIDYDRNGFDLDDVEYDFNDFTMGSIQTPIEALKE